MKKVVTVKKKALAANEEHAATLRTGFVSSGTLVLNLISSPGSGKTTLLEATIGELGKQVRTAVIEGDVETERDADRIRALGVPAHQILTGGACHLDARMISDALADTQLMPTDILFIENVGNLICPTGYDLGEDLKIAVLSTTEGDDKPFKYPAIFSRAEVTVVTKIDLLPHLDFDLEAVREHLATLNPSGRVFVTSSQTMEGIKDWCSFITDQLNHKRQNLSSTSTD
ncbi:MAG: hydrogenase nickel incorporation protein HypB [bacterium]|nr:hydrogenase nickel incorporation protein HypB [bacterium]